MHRKNYTPGRHDGALFCCFDKRLCFRCGIRVSLRLRSFIQALFYLPAPTQLSCPVVCCPECICVVLPRRVLSPVISGAVVLPLQQ